jgi:ParB family chromosome partitioning protein
MTEDVAKKRLGRGLAALMGDTGSEELVIDRARGLRQLSIESIHASKHNPRSHFDESALEDLVQSIKARGIIQPILVRQMDSGDFEIIAGERRWRAARKAGLQEIPAVVRDIGEQEALEIAIVENVQRSDLNILEEAMGYQQLIDQFQYTQAQLADVIGKSRSHIANTLRLLKLPEKVCSLIGDGLLSAGHARALIGREDAEELAQKIIEENLTVRDIERIVQWDGNLSGAESPKKSKEKYSTVKDADTLALEERLTEILGLTAKLHAKKNGSGELKLKYDTLEQLDDILKKLGAFY